MSRPIITVKALGKKYRLGQFGASSLRDELHALGRRLSGKAVQKAHRTDFWALKNISFDIEPGKITGIIGRNGAGKSTLLKLISRITEPTEGDIFLNGSVSSLLEVGTGFHPELSHRKNLYLNGTILGMRKSEIDRKIDEIVRFAGVEKHIDTPVKRYSSGMNVRLGFSIAAHLDSDILIIDEVLAVGDNAFQQKCIQKIKSLAEEENRTLLFVSHNMSIVSSLCEHCIWLDKGGIVDSGPTDEIVNAYVSHMHSISLQHVSEREDRRGTGRIRIEEVSVLDESGQSARTLNYGSPVTIQIRVSEIPANLSCFMKVINKRGFSVTYFNSVINENTLHEGTNSIIELSIPHFSLADGSYTLNVCIMDDAEYLDDMESTVNFEVQGSPLSRTPNESPDTAGYVLLPHHWKMPLQSS